MIKQLHPSYCGGGVMDTQLETLRAGQDMRDANSYAIEEVRRLTGYAPKRFKEILKRLRCRISEKTGLDARLTKTNGTCLAEQYADWLLYERFPAPTVYTRPKAFVTRKQVREWGICKERIDDLIGDDTAHVLVYKGRYHISEHDVEELLATLPKKAPATMIPLFHISETLGVTRQAVHEWVKRHTCGHTFLHPTRRCQPARYISVHDAYRYFYKHFRNAHQALERLRSIGQDFARYARGLARADVHPATPAQPAQEQAPTERSSYKKRSRHNLDILKRANAGHVLLSL